MSLTRPESSKALLKYVLESAPEGSLKDLSGIVRLEGTKPQTVGGFSEVYKCSFKGKYIAVKKLLLKESEDYVTRNFARELRVLARLSHPNVTAFLGYVWEEEENNYYILSAWMEKGSLRSCMAGFSIRKLFVMVLAFYLTVRFSNLPLQSLGIAKGLCYLHGVDVQVVHGDIKADNVLVSPSGEPVLTDFGISRMKESVASRSLYTTDASRSSMRWLPFEYYQFPDFEKFRFTPKSDVWAFGMTLLELLTGEIPYADIIKGNEGAVQGRMMAQKRPAKPKFNLEGPDLKLKDDMWSLCLKCWVFVRKKEDLERLSMPEKLEYLERVIKQERRPTMQAVLKELIRMKYRHDVGL